MIHESVNILSAFCGRRDVPELTREALRSDYGFSQADVMVLFGGSIICGGDVLAKAIKNQVAKKFVIVGGVGHTTEALRDSVHLAFPEIETDSLTESELFQAYLKRKHGLEADYLETKSTNCGNNITNLLALLKDKAIPHKTMILSQDATMQLRMHATIKKYRPDIQAVNFATYEARLGPDMTYADSIPGTWPIERFVSLLLGEIRRLTDNADGYGPKGRDFISHIDIPKKVEEAYVDLLAHDCRPR